MTSEPSVRGRPADRRLNFWGRARAALGGVRTDSRHRPARHNPGYGVDAAHASGRSSGGRLASQTLVTATSSAEGPTPATRIPQPAETMPATRSSVCPCASDSRRAAASISAPVTIAHALAKSRNGTATMAGHIKMTPATPKFTEPSKTRSHQRSPRGERAGQDREGAIGRQIGHKYQYQRRDLGGRRRYQAHKQQGGGQRAQTDNPPVARQAGAHRPRDSRGRGPPAAFRRSRVRQGRASQVTRQMRLISSLASCVSRCGVRRITEAAS